MCYNLSMIKAFGRDFARSGRYISICLALLIVLTAFTPVQAQDTGSADLTALDASSFPQIETFMHAWDAGGAFVGGLQANQVTVIEDGARIAVTELEELDPGAVFVVAINPGRSFAIRDGQGISRYDLIREVLAAWAGETGASQEDDLSLIINDGPVGMHLSGRAEFLATLNQYDGEARTAEPGMDLFSTAINSAAGTAAPEGTGRAVLLITALPSGDITLGIPDLASISKQAGVRVSVWLVAPAGVITTPAASAFSDLAAQTGGEFFLYSGVENFPTPENYIAKVRGSYRLSYRSQMAASGEHTVMVEIDIPGGEVIASPLQTFNLDLQPPAPELESAPSNIVRENPEDAEDVSVDLLPTSQELTVRVGFPDGMPREVLTTTLYVDGVVAGIQTGTLTGTFTWDISRYLESGQHMLKLETVDSQGMIGSSPDYTVDIQVKRTQPSIWVTVSKNVPWFVGLVVLLTGTVLVTVLIVTGKIRPRIALQDEKTIPNARTKARSLRKRQDPVTQPVKVREETGSRAKPGILARLSWPHRRTTAEAAATLHRVSESETEVAIPPIPLSKTEMIIGKDGGRCDLVVDDPSVDPVHARLTREGSSFRISDAGSIAGTWVDYSPVSEEGTLLEHGDIIHIGRVGFKLSLKDSARALKPVIKTEEPPP